MLQIEAINSTAYYSRHALTEGREARVQGLGLSIYREEPGRRGGCSRCSRRLVMKSHGDADVMRRRGAKAGAHVERLSSNQFWRVQNLHLMERRAMNKTIKWKPH